MKKLVLIGLAAIALAACGNQDDNQNNQENNNNTSEVSSDNNSNDDSANSSENNDDQNENDANDDNDNNDDDKDDQNESNNSGNDSKIQLDSEITDDDLITAKLVSIKKDVDGENDDDDDNDDIEIEMTITNNSDKTIVVKADSVTINGEEIAPENIEMDEDISSGETDDADLEIEDLSNEGLPELAGELSFTLHVIDANSQENIDSYQVTANLD